MCLRREAGSNFTYNLLTSNHLLVYAARYAATQVYGTYSVRVPSRRVRYVPVRYKHNET